MPRIALLENPIREYAWGSRTAPSFVELPGGRRSLLAWIEDRRREILGARARAAAGAYRANGRGTLYRAAVPL